MSFQALFKSRENELNKEIFKLSDIFGEEHRNDFYNASLHAVMQHTIVKNSTLGYVRLPIPKRIKSRFALAQFLIRKYNYPKLKTLFVYNKVSSSNYPDDAIDLEEHIVKIDITTGKIKINRRYKQIMGAEHFYMLLDSHENTIDCTYKNFKKILAKHAPENAQRKFAHFSSINWKKYI